MAYQSVFKRYELKYLLTQEQKARILAAMEPYMALDQYGRTTIRNLYFDTDNYRLVRRSIEKPAYKEKLRMRSYRQAGPDSTVFVELKKKYDSVVYKRRLALTEREAMAWVSGGREASGKEETDDGMDPRQDGTWDVPQSQIAREIEYFMKFYGSLRPVVFLSYEREAYYSKDGSDFRVTFDDHILCRESDLSLQEEADGIPLLDVGLVLMELKCSGGIPLWMTRILSEERIYKTSFSKYGTAYEKIIFPIRKGEHNDV
ncbi:MAG: polyphosphate polymerase domain-containing protein [Lachnospiraceae bacterium]|nr:polyphosphate polymerase domain-containing protein [Lachnospiraceae bacterium]